MARTERAPLRGRIELIGEETRERPALRVHALAADGQVTGSADVTEGDFSLPAAAVGKAAKIVIGPAEQDPAQASSSLRAFRVEEFQQMVAAGPVRLPEAVWGPWHLVVRCVSGRVRRCRPFPWWLRDIAAVAGVELDATARVLAARSPHLPRATAGLIDPRVLRPPFGCARVCQGRVEVYRRVCCCRPPFLDLGDLVEEPRLPDPFPLPIDPPRPAPGPFPPSPIPGGDPVPWHLLSAVTTAGALDTRKLNAVRDRQTLQALPAEQRATFLAARPYLWCTCGAPKKVAEGFVTDDGSFSVCWSQPWLLPLPGCRERFAYRVIQSIDGAAVTIYDGVAAGQWFGAGADPTLTSFSPVAVTCIGTPDVPGADGAVVVLHEIGHTDSWRLATPDQTGPDAVDPPGVRSGLLDAAVTDGEAVNRPWGGNLNLRYFISDGMKGLDARYYRVSVAPAVAGGGPGGAWTTLPAPTWESWRWTGTGWQQATHSLHAGTVGSEPDLRHIPYQTGGLLAANEEWADDQYLATFASAGQPDGDYLVRIEVFDGGGNRLRPTGADGAGTEKAFIYGRWTAATDPFQPVPYAALTHLLRCDNRSAVAAVEQLHLQGVPSGDTCQFLTGAADDAVRVGYRAYHPASAPPSFLARRRLTITKGLGAGSTTTVVFDDFGEAGKPPAGPGLSPPVTLQQLLGTDTKCALAIRLDAVVKTTNGSGTLNALNDSVQAAFAAEIV